MAVRRIPRHGALLLTGVISERQGASVGDIDGDRQLEVVLGTTSGRVYALLGADGTDKAGFPFQTRGRIMAPVLLTQVPCPSQLRGRVRVICHLPAVYPVHCSRDMIENETFESYDARGQHLVEDKKIALSDCTDELRRELVRLPAVA